jgi:hypothetical protein
MPDPSAFLAGFGLSRGLKLAGYTLVDLSISHTTIVRNRQYEYPITFVFQYNGIETNDHYPELYAALHLLIDRTLTINSRYGNPYSCSIELQTVRRDVINGKNDIVFHLLGHSHRI